MNSQRPQETIRSMAVNRWVAGSSPARGSRFSSRNLAKFSPSSIPFGLARGYAGATAVQSTSLRLSGNGIVVARKPR